MPELNNIYIRPRGELREYFRFSKQTFFWLFCITELDKKNRQFSFLPVQFF